MMGQFRSLAVYSFSSSSLLRTVFSEAARAGKRFRVIVADGRPRFEGRAMARHMVSAGIECSYIQVRIEPYTNSNTVCSVYKA